MSLTSETVDEFCGLIHRAQYGDVHEYWTWLKERDQALRKERSDARAELQSSLTEDEVQELSLARQQLDEAAKVLAEGGLIGGALSNELVLAAADRIMTTVLDGRGSPEDRRVVDAYWTKYVTIVAYPGSTGR